MDSSCARADEPTGLALEGIVRSWKSPLDGILELIRRKLLASVENAPHLEHVVEITIQNNTSKFTIARRKQGCSDPTRRKQLDKHHLTLSVIHTLFGLNGNIEDERRSRDRALSCDEWHLEELRRPSLHFFAPSAALGTTRPTSDATWWSDPPLPGMLSRLTDAN